MGVGSSPASKVLALCLMPVRCRQCLLHRCVEVSIEVDSQSLWTISSVRIANSYLSGALEVAAEHIQNGIRRATNDCAPVASTVCRQCLLLFLH